MLDKAVILLAEDDQNDVLIMKKAIARAGIPNPVQVLDNGRKVVEYLAGKGEFGQREKFPLPGLMLLDLKMPWMDGFDVLMWLRGRPSFDALPVVVLTASKLQSDIDRTRALGVYDYRVKPHLFEDLVRLLDDVRKCWLDERFNRFAAASHEQDRSEARRAV